MSDTVLLRPERRRRHRHAEPAGRDERAEHRAQGGAARHPARRPPRTPPYARVLLTGTGRAFCVGQDLAEHAHEPRRATSTPSGRTVPEHYTPIATALATMPKPVVAAVNGVAAGAGAAFAFACDFRVVADDRRLQHGVLGGRAVRRLRLVVDAAPAGRHGQGQGAAAAARRRSRPRRRSSSGWPPRSSRPTRSPSGPARSPYGWPPARRSPTARSGGRWPSRPGTASTSRSTSSGR